MSISPVGWIANSEEHLKLLSKTVTEITHNHPEVEKLVKQFIRQLVVRSFNE